MSEAPKPRLANADEPALVNVDELESEIPAAERELDRAKSRRRFSASIVGLFGAGAALWNGAMRVPHPARYDNTVSGDAAQSVLANMQPGDDAKTIAKKYDDAKRDEADARKKTEDARQVVCSQIIDNMKTHAAVATPAGTLLGFGIGTVPVRRRRTALEKLEKERSEAENGGPAKG